MRVPAGRCLGQPLSLNLANAKCSLGFTRGASSRNRVQLAGLLSCICCSRLNGNDRQDRGSLVPDDGFRCLGHGALHCQYVFHSARNPDRNRSRYIALVEAGKAAALKADFYSFAVGNLIPVTIGNIIGGSVLVGMLYLAANIKKA